MYVSSLISSNTTLKILTTSKSIPDEQITGQTCVLHRQGQGADHGV